MLFEYKALLNNRESVGQLEAETEKEVIDYLKGNGYFPLDIHVKQSAQALIKINRFFERISFSDITYLTRQFAIMLTSGLTLIDCIEILKKQAKKTPMKSLLADIDKSLREGKAFSLTLKKYPKYFSHLYVALVRSGEASGKLDIILNKLAENLERQKEFRAKIKNALIYPVVIITAMISMMFIMLSFVVPRLVELYKNFQVELSPQTQLLINVSDFFEAFWVYILIGMIGTVILIKRIISSSSGKRFFDTYILRIPVFGPIVKSAALVDTTRTLSILISSGVPILDGLEIVTNVNENVLFQEAFKRIREKVEKGLSVGVAMSNEPIFPDSLVQMTIVGEQTGHLDKTLDKVAEYYQSESELAVKAMLTLIEPAILVVLGVAVGFLVFAVLSPIFTLTSSLQ